VSAPQLKLSRLTIGIPQPLAQVELLVLFSPALQGAPLPKDAFPVNCSQAWLTVDVHGTRAKSEITGRSTVEDMRLEVNGDDIESLLPEDTVAAIAAYVGSES
jgi:hypothetical protein